MSKTILVFGPHPDDAEWYAGGFLIKKIREENARVLIVIATDGRVGSYSHKADILAGVRKTEAEKALKLIGANPPIWLGHHDFSLDALPSGSLREQFIRQIRLHKPDIVVSVDPWDMHEPHPDHRVVAREAADAINYASLPGVHPEHLSDGLFPHFIPEKYYYSDTLQNSNKIIDITSEIELKIACLLEHQSQVEFLVEGLFCQFRNAGIKYETILGQELSHESALEMAIRAQASEIGSLSGVEYAEAFRYERYHPLVEKIMQSGEPSISSGGN